MEIATEIINNLNKKFNLNLGIEDAAQMAKEGMKILAHEFERRTRMKGNSTRQIDRAIQTLFNGEIVVAKDHWRDGTHIDANKDLFDRILKRLRAEHNLERLIDQNWIRIDRDELEIELLIVS